MKLKKYSFLVLMLLIIKVPSVNAVEKVVAQNLKDGFILPFAAERTLEAAKASNIGR